MKKKVTLIVLSLIGALLGILLLLLIIGQVLAPDFRKIKTTAGFPVNQDRYLTLSNGDQVWVDVWLPPDLDQNHKIGTVIETSRYGEMWEPGWLLKLMQTYLGESHYLHDSIPRYTEMGYAYVWIQSPGTGQSTGARAHEYPAEELEAINKAISWIAEQPWSNQRVAATGISYAGTTSDISAAAGRDELKVVIPMSPDFDTYLHTIAYGGIPNTQLITHWIDLCYYLDTGDFKGLMDLSGEDNMGGIPASMIDSIASGLKVPTNQETFNQAQKDHRDNFTRETLPDVFGSTDGSDKNFSLEDMTRIIQLKPELEQAGIPNYTFAGWFDAAIAEGALLKYNSIQTPQQLVILPSDHALQSFIDPFNDSGPSAREPLESVYSIETEKILNQHLSGQESLPERRISYFTYGTNQWQHTDIWPPADLTSRTLYLREQGELSAVSPADPTGSDLYNVDFTATNGDFNRWFTQTGAPVSFIDRTKEDQKLLTYTTAPLERSLEVTGTVNVTLYLRSSQTDGAFYVYLEDVSPEGDVVYLTEGSLRGIHRKTVNAEELPFTSIGGFNHTYLAEDMESMNPGEITELNISLSPISTVFKQGHSIRIAIAGHDDARQIRIPSEGEVNLQIERNRIYASHIIVPSKER